MPPPRSATTGCKNSHRAAWCRSRSLMGLRNSGCAVYGAAWSRVVRRTAIRSRPARYRAFPRCKCKTPHPGRFAFHPRKLFLLGGGFVGLFLRGQHFALLVGRELLADAGRLAGEAAQVVELGAAHIALALHLDAD